MNALAIAVLSLWVSSPWTHVYECILEEMAPHSNLFHAAQEWADEPQERQHTAHETIPGIVKAECSADTNPVGTPPITLAIGDWPATVAQGAPVTIPFKIESPARVVEILVQFVGAKDLPFLRMQFADGTDGKMLRAAAIMPPRVAEALTIRVTAIDARRCIASAPGGHYFSVEKD